MKYIVALTLLACGCNWNAASQDEVDSLKRRVSALEEKLNTATGDAKADLADCLNAAADRYQQFAILNGTTSTSKDGQKLIHASNRIWDLADKEKQIAIEECKARYGASRNNPP